MTTTEQPAAPPLAAVFDVCGPLPTGTTVLEASAGTGKTFTIAALATRYVAEGVADLSRLLLVTFGRAATSELRDRVRERLVSAERALLADDARTAQDPLVRHLASVDDAELAARRRRLRAALAQFDAATIATTHGFCQQMLASLGLAADVDADAVLVPDLADLVDEVVDDLYVLLYADTPAPPLSVEEARQVARAAVGSPQARLEPAAAAPGSPAGHRYAFAHAAAAEVTRRKRARRVLDYDDLLVELRDALVDPAHGDDAVARVRSRYDVVLVDEFQDTDPVQWEILATAFHGRRTLVLIGDPKQAIYAFRGGDVVAYLAARGVADHSATLGRSWRSDAPLLAGLEHLLGGAALGDPRIVVRPVEAAHPERRFTGGAPVRLRHLSRPVFGVPARSSTKPLVQAVREAIATDVAADVVRQLGSSQLRDGGGWRPVVPADVAVLARRNVDATTVRDALVAAGVPAVVSGLSSVFDSPAARAWLTLLVALEQPGNPGRTAAAALTPFVGWDATRLGTATDADRDALSDRVRSWAQLLGARGVAALFEAASADGLAERLLVTATGERTLTDLRHVAQSLHLTATAEGLGTAALTDWLRRRIAEAALDYAEERSRRLETDAAAVQVVTVHASKGLEFPVVYVPFAWDRFESSTPPILRHHDGEARVLDVGGPGTPGYDTARSLHMAEERGEDLRLLYVALTRACSQVVVHWAPSSNSAAGPLSRVLLGRPGAGQEPPPSVPVGRDDEAARAFDALAASSVGTVVVEHVDTLPSPARWAPAGTGRPDLTVAPFGRRLDTTWRRTSYTALTAAAHEERYAAEAALGGAPTGAAGALPGDPGGPGGSGVSSEPETRGVEDEPPPPAPGLPPTPATTAATTAGTPQGVSAGGAADDVPLPLADLPAGAAFGVLVHEVLEYVDTSASDLGAELLRRCRDAGAARFGGVDPVALAAALGAVLATPLGPAVPGLALRDVRPVDRLAELEFELPLAGGDSPTGRGATIAAIGDLLGRHLPAADPFRPYADHLMHAPFAATRLRGYLTGSLDAVLRVRGPGPGGSAAAAGPEPRYLVVDYKTNRLAPAGEPLTAAHYRCDALVEAMTEADYPLQLLLYLVALHRFLTWRQPGYDPDVHLGGGLYLFVRGMAGPSTPAVDGTPSGVMAWRPPGALVAGLSTLLDTGEAP
ncbi:UvrD-helicase domain-containing protein [Kineosporia sp. A_224]|uniref:UvrD-helicase domain-containing protein n=1 Tax=Kineosporia sp. A_224 TaxID=1962180 RepID=UPI000B4C0E26|nr:UvrD-helicase domain-containing protein [Kineosporia sp. A_224]